MLFGRFPRFAGFRVLAGLRVWAGFHLLALFHVFGRCLGMCSRPGMPSCFGRSSCWAGLHVLAGFPCVAARHVWQAFVFGRFSCVAGLHVLAGFRVPAAFHVFGRFSCFWQAFMSGAPLAQMAHPPSEPAANEQATARAIRAGRAEARPARIGQVAGKLATVQEGTDKQADTHIAQEG